MPLQRDPIVRHRDPVIHSALAGAASILASVGGDESVMIAGKEYTCFADSADVRQVYADDGGSVDSATTQITVPMADLRKAHHAEAILRGESYRIAEISYDGANSHLSLITDSAE